MIDKFDLNSLVVSEKKIATESVAATLNGLITIIQESGEVVPSSNFNKLDNNRKVLTYLLGLKACALLNLGSLKVTADAEEIANVIGVDAQRARELLSRLKGKFLQKVPAGWQVSSARISAVCEEISNKKN